MFNKMDKVVSVSITIIPPRFRNGTLKAFINSILNQTYPIKNIYITIPNNYKRFKNFTDDELNEIKSYSDKIIINKHKIDSPLLKHIGTLDLADDDEYLFIGDDDQEYHPELISKMVKGIYDVNAVYQNRYHIVKHGTAGIVHGFVGLMYRKALINNFRTFPIPEQVWTDDQLMSIYFHKHNIPINPSPINDFDDIYSYLNIHGHEKLGTGGDLCLSDETNKRDDEIKKLEKLYDVYFHMKNNHNSKGRIYDYDYNTVINLYIVSFKSLCENKLLELNDFIGRHKHLNINLKLVKEYCNELDIPLKHLPDYHVKYYQDKIGIEKVKKNGGIYISIDNDLNDIHILEFILSDKNYFKCDKGIINVNINL